MYLLIFLLLFSLPSLAEACQQYRDVVQDRNGHVIAGTTVTIVYSGTPTVATIYSDSECVVSTPNPLTTGSDGTFSTFLADGEYGVDFAKTGYTFTPIPRLSIYDPLGENIKTVAYFSGNTDLCAAGTGAIDQIGATQITLVINKPVTCSTNKTMPATTKLQFMGGGLITIATGQVLTIEAPDKVIAPSTMQVFAGAGTVAFTRAGTVYPTWKATNTSPGTTDMTAALQWAADQVRTNGGTFVLVGGAFGFSACIDFTHLPAVVFQIAFEKSYLKNLAGSPISCAIYILSDGNKSAFRQPIELTEVDIRGESQLFSGILVDFDGSGNSDIVSIRQAYVENTTICYDIYSVMESEFTNLTGYTCGVGTRLTNNTVGGGGNANTWTNVKCTNCGVSLMVHQVGSLPMTNNTFTGLLTQGTSTAGVLISGLVFTLNIVGAHFENTNLINPTGTAAVEFGTFASSSTKNVTKADISLYSAQEINFIGNSGIGAVYGSTQTALEGSGETTIAKNISFTDTSLGSGGSWVKGLQNVNLFGTSLDATLVDVLDFGTLNLNGFYRSLVVTAPEAYQTPFGNGYPNTFNGFGTNAPAGGSTDGTDLTYGIFRTVTCAASAGSYGTNSVAMGSGTNITSGKYGYASFIVMSGTTTTVNVAVSGTEALGPSHMGTISLVANVPKLVRLSTFASTGNDAWAIGVFPVGSDGPTLTVYSPYLTPVTNVQQAGYLATKNVGDSVGAFTSLSLTLKLQANLGTPANGTFYYCSDCNKDATCTGGGGGAFAKRLNAGWVCN